MATKGTVLGVIANMVTLTVDGPVAQNEICYIMTGGDRLMAEVIKVVGQNVYVQVFESTRGLKVGAEAEFTGHMLEVTLGPGMLSKNYDGLQNDLDKMEGVFLKRGQYTYPLDKEKKMAVQADCKGRRRSRSFSMAGRGGRKSPAPEDYGTFPADRNL